MSLFWLHITLKLSFFFKFKNISAMKEVSFKNFLIHAFTLRLRGVKNIIIHTGFRTLQVANRFEPAI